MPLWTHAPDSRDPAWITWPVVGFLFVLVASSLSGTALSDPDTLWHIAAGRWMVEHRALPMRDMFSWTMPGAPWTAHEWLSELVLYGAWSVAGLRGAVALSAVCFALTAAYLARFLCDRLEPQQILPIGLLFVGLISTHYLARPHVLVWPLLAYWTGTLVATVDTERPPPWWLLGLLLLWANLHASFTLGLAMAAGLALDAVVEAPTAAERWVRIRHWGRFGIGCLVAVSLNPNGLGTLWHALQLMQMKETLGVVNEWKSANFHEFQLILLWMVLVFGLALGGRLRLSPVRVLLLLALFYMALKHVRYHSTLALTSLFLLATPLASALRLSTARREEGDVEALDALMRRLTAPTRRLATGAAILIGAAWLGGAARWIPSAPNDGITPSRALAAYRATGRDTGGLFNSYAFGGYLIYQGIPVFIDGRADMYGDAFVKEVTDVLMMKRPHALERYLDDRQIRWTMLTPGTPAVELLDHLPAWRRLYADSVAVVHLRREVFSGVAPSSPRRVVPAPAPSTDRDPDGR